MAFVACRSRRARRPRLLSHVPGKQSQRGLAGQLRLCLVRNTVYKPSYVRIIERRDYLDDCCSMRKVHVILAPLIDIGPTVHKSRPQCFPLCTAKYLDRAINIYGRYIASFIYFKVLFEGASLASLTRPLHIILGMGLQRLALAATIMEETSAPKHSQA